VYTTTIVTRVLCTRVFRRTSLRTYGVCVYSRGQVIQRRVRLGNDPSGLVGGGGVFFFFTTTLARDIILVESQHRYVVTIVFVGLRHIYIYFGHDTVRTRNDDEKINNNLRRVVPLFRAPNIGRARDHVHTSISLIYYRNTWR